MTTPGNHEEDVLTRVNRLIEADDLAQAVAVITDLETVPDQVAVLSGLVDDIIRALELALMLDPDRGFDLDPGLMLELFHDLERAQELARALAVVRDIELVQALDLAASLAMALELAYNFENKLFESFRHRRQQHVVIMRVLEKLVGPERERRVRFTLDGIDTLTPQILGEQVVPYLQAIVDLQRIIDQVQGNPFIQPRIVSLTQSFPVGVVLEGAAKAYTAVREHIIPWRRDHQQQLAELEIAERRHAIATQEAEIMERRAKAQQTRAEADKARAETDKIREEAEKLRIEIEKARHELNLSKVEKALELLKRFSPDLPENERLGHLPKMYQVIDTIGESRLSIAQSG
jgi:tetratricopeptide (TPR) repeat protein